MKRLRIGTLTMPALLLWALCVTAGAAETCDALYGEGKSRIALATGSPGELGLVEALALPFARENAIALCWKKAGSGESLQLLKDKQVDLIMVHAPAAERQAVEQGWAAHRTLIGSNEFFIVGPPSDPAAIAQASSAADAYGRIAQARAGFLSRGDNSGTHKKEMSIWKLAGIAPEGSWYQVSSDFMLATLRKADLEGAYFMVDSSTWAAAHRELPNLVVLFRGDPVLINTYHALAQPDGAGERQPQAVRFIRFVASDAGQEIIRNFGKGDGGEPLYNDAAYASCYAD